MTKDSGINSKNISESNIIYFPEGLLGLEHLNRYVLLSPESELPFRYLQSVEDDSLAVVVIDPYLYMPDYRFNIYDDVIDFLHISEASDVLALSVVVIPKDIKSMTANFAAPVLVNVNNRTAKQVVLQENVYNIRHPIFEEYKALISQGAV